MNIYIFSAIGFVLLIILFFGYIRSRVVIDDCRTRLRTIYILLDSLNLVNSEGDDWAIYAAMNAANIEKQQVKTGKKVEK